MTRIFRHIVQRMMILFLLLGGMGLVCQEAQAAPAARAMWDANTKTLTFYYGEQKSGGTTHYSGTEITATGSTFPAWYNSSIYSNITTVVFESSFASVRPTSCHSWFRGMPKLTTITGINYLNTTNVTTMAYMFYLSTALTSLDLSSFNTANVTTMGYMFSGCSGLTSLNLSSFNTAKVTNMTCMFYDCSNLRIICVNESGWSTAAVTSSTNMFYRCYKLVGGNGTVFNSSYTNQTRACIDKPGQVGYLTCATEYGTCGAAGHESDVTWLLGCDNVLTISGSGAMADYTTSSTSPWYSHRNAITSVTIADGITSIGSYAFNSCTNLQSVTIPPSLTAVGGYAFNDCFAMDKLYITDLTAWCNISFTGNYSTPFCRNCYSTHRGGGNLYVNGVKVTTLRIPDGITAIKDYTFLGFAGVTSLQLNQVTTIGDYAFRGCIALTSLTIPEGVTTIGTSAFHYNIKLENLTIPSSVTFMGSKTFDFCNILTDIYVSWNTSSSIPQWPTNFTTKSPQTDITLHIPCGTASLYQAATGWKSYTIVEDMPNIKSGTYGPDNIEWSFDYCDSTLSITGNGELRCDNNNWGPNAGGINPNLVKRVFVGKGVTYLGIYTLSYMSNIEYIEVEDGHPTHRTGCNAIIRIGTEQEGDTLIFGCPHTVIPTTCTTIRGYAFWDDHLVTEMTIPSSVRQIANMQGSLWQGNNGNVFYTSNNTGEGLKDLYVEWTKLEDIPAVPNNRLGDMTKVRLHVPCGTTALYKQVTGWKNFKEYIEEVTSYTVTVQTATGDESMGTVRFIED